MNPCREGAHGEDRIRERYELFIMVFLFVFLLEASQSYGVKAGASVVLS